MGINTEVRANIATPNTLKELTLSAPLMIGESGGRT